MLDVFTVGGETLCGNAPLIVTLNRAGTAYDNVMFGGGQISTRPCEMQSQLKQHRMVSSEAK